VQPLAPATLVRSKSRKIEVADDVADDAGSASGTLSAADTITIV
jgi:hypothetical protein